jgi:hypothetical protein
MKTAAFCHSHARNRTNPATNVAIWGSPVADRDSAHRSATPSGAPGVRAGRTPGVGQVAHAGGSPWRLALAANP